MYVVANSIVQGLPDIKGKSIYEETQFAVAMFSSFSTAIYQLTILKMCILYIQLLKKGELWLL